MLLGLAGVAGRCAGLGACGEAWFGDLCHHHQRDQPGEALSTEVRGWGAAACTPALGLPGDTLPKPTSEDIQILISQTV